MPVAGHSLRAPPFARSVLTRFGIPPALVSKRRLSGTGSPSLPCQEAQSRKRWDRGCDRRSGLPMPVAGRSLRAPPFARSVLTRFGIPPALVSKRRLSGTGSPSLAEACFACRRQDGGESGAANLGFASA
jgi:hypothetical protein